MLIGLLIFYHSKNRIIKTLAILYPVLIGFSRIYIGMHFIHDVVFGYLLGSVLFGVYLYLFPWIEKFLGSISLLATNLLLHLAALFTLLLYPKGLINSYCILLSGFAMGIYLTSVFHFFIRPDECFYKKILITLIGFIGSYAIYQFAPFDLSFRLYTTSIWISFCTNALFFWIFPKTIKWKNRSIP